MVKRNQRKRFTKSFSTLSESLTKKYDRELALGLGTPVRVLQETEKTREIHVLKEIYWAEDSFSGRQTNLEAIWSVKLGVLAVPVWP